MPASPKHKRKETNPLSSDELEAMLDALTKSILSLNGKQQHIIKEWLETWGTYITAECSFDPKKLMYYKRGDVVLVRLGYNIGNELGGTRYAIVVECNNSKSSGIVSVVPLSTLEAGKTPSDLHKSEVFLGKVIDDKDCFAMPLQMRPVSKLRIITPRFPHNRKITVSGNLLDLIDKKIELLFTKQGLT
jgi:mRNA-degrading endonuclease toxin of MazEF toxin-antitoxin module